MVEWSDAAIEAAMSAYWKSNWEGKATDQNYRYRIDAMREALDPAVKAKRLKDGLSWRELKSAIAEIDESYRIGWNAAIEAAALEAEKMVGGFSAAAEIRKLAKE